MCKIKLFFFIDVPTQMPPLTPGTNKKMIEVLKESFKSWEEAAQDRNITKGKYLFLFFFITFYYTFKRKTCGIHFV